MEERYGNVSAQNAANTSLPPEPQEKLSFWKSLTQSQANKPSDTTRTSPNQINIPIQSQPAQSQPVQPQSQPQPQSSCCNPFQIYSEIKRDFPNDSLRQSLMYSYYHVWLAMGFLYLMNLISAITLMVILPNSYKSSFQVVFLGIFYVLVGPILGYFTWFASIYRGCMGVTGNGFLRSLHFLFMIGQIGFWIAMFVGSFNAGLCGLLQLLDVNAAMQIRQESSQRTVLLLRYSYFTITMPGPDSVQQQQVTEMTAPKLPKRTVY